MRKILLILAMSLLTVCAVNAQKKTVKYNQYGVAVESDVLDVEAQDGILVLESPKSGYKFWFDVRAQADGAVFFGAPDYADPIGNGTSIRRARFAVKGQINDDWYGEFDMDLANGLAELKDAIVRYTGIANTDLQAGNFKENFSIQRNTTSRYLQFMERPMVCSALTPSRHIGINAKYAKDWLWVSAGAFSQVIAGSEEWTNVADNNKDFGRNSGYSLTAKVVFRPLYKQRVNGELTVPAAATPPASTARSIWTPTICLASTTTICGPWSLPDIGTDSVTKQPTSATTYTSRATPQILQQRISAAGMHRQAICSLEVASSMTPVAASTPRSIAEAASTETWSFAPAMRTATSTSPTYTVALPRLMLSDLTGMSTTT